MASAPVGRGVCLVIGIAVVAAGDVRADSADPRRADRAPTVAAAEPAGGPGVEVGLFLGANYFGDNIELGNSSFDDQTPRASPMFGLRLALHLLDRLGLELEGKLATTSTEGDRAAGRASVTSHVFGWRGHLVYTVFPERSLRPFLVLGCGGETLVADDAPRELALTSPDTDAIAYWGLGAKLPIDDASHGLRFDLRNGFAPGRDPRITATFEFSFGLYLTLGSSARPVVERTVVIERGASPEPPPPGPVDTDGDGIPDVRDGCPNEPELINAIDDDDGCPELDSDGDGLLGSRDGCPEEAEDRDGYQDGDGCPDRDNDGDGIEDTADKCPNEAELVNGFQDADGCPDEVPDEVKGFTGVIAGINFRIGSAEIRPESHGRLNQAVDLFRRYPDIRIEIAGHTDNRGGDAINLALSQRRAESVKGYLVDAGIDTSRLTVVGYGPNRPIADNDTRAGRAQNRRIEFRLISGSEPSPAPSQPGGEGNSPTPGN
jgi:OOP family OmpA-OmpF porin